MRFVVAGDCVEAVFLAEAMAVSDQHQLLTASVTDEVALAMSGRGISYTLVNSPEEAVLDPACEAVLVAASDVDQSMALVRQASQAGRHVIVIPPKNVSTAFSFELHLLLDESERGIVPLCGRWYVDWPDGNVSLKTDVQQLSLSFPLVSDNRDHAQLAGVDALCGCGWAFSQVTALDVRGADGQLLSRSIMLAASEASERNVPPATLSFSADAGVDSAAVVVRPANGENRRYVTALPTPETVSNAKLQAGVLSRIVARLSDETACQAGMEAFSNTLELMEGVEKSLRRRRTVDVYFDGVSERSAFKTQMTAIGCGVLSYLMFGLIAFLIVAKVANLPSWALQVGRILWITPLVLFLLAQLLLPLARERTGQKEASNPNSPTGGE
ncbi:MAG: hypothetical protein R3C59_17525 [Planctomycetaceae bacterium]